MPIGNVHNHPQAGILCECTAHKEARAASAKAGKVSKALLEAAKAGDREKEKVLCEELEKLNTIARQCD